MHERCAAILYTDIPLIFIDFYEFSCIRKARGQPWQYRGGTIAVPSESITPSNQRKIRRFPWIEASLRSIEASKPPRLDWEDTLAGEIGKIGLDWVRRRRGEPLGVPLQHPPWFLGHF